MPIEYQDELSVAPEYFPPAGFWLRVWATLFDIAILALPKALINAAIGLYIVEALDKFVSSSPKDSSAALMTLLPIILSGFILGFGAFLFIGILYNPVMESSRIQGTPGKRLLGIIVTDIYGERITFLRALGRQMARWVSIVPMLAGMLTAIAPLAIGQKPGGAAALAMILGALASTILSVIHYPMAGWTQHKQALHDKVAKTYVVRFRHLTFGEYAVRALFSVILAFAVPAVCSEFVKHAFPSAGQDQADGLLKKLKPWIESFDTKKSEKQSGWREIKPIWRDGASESSTASKSASRRNVTLVTVQPSEKQKVAFDAKSSVTVGFEPLEGVEPVQKRCVNKCMTLSSGAQTAQGAAAKIVAKPKDGQVTVILENIEEFPIEVVVFTE